MGYFPFFMELSGRPGLIVGGGTVCLRKVEKLLPYGPALTVISPHFVPELLALPGLTLERRTFRPSDVEPFSFVIAATDQPDLNREISGLCRTKNIPVNVADDREACTFLFPALVKRGGLSVGISTGGSSPTAAIWLKEQIAGLLPDHLEDILSWLEQQRPVLKGLYPREEDRSALFQRLFAACLSADRPLTDEELQAMLKERESL